MFISPFSLPHPPISCAGLSTPKEREEARRALGTDTSIPFTKGMTVDDWLENLTFLDMTTSTPLRPDGGDIEVGLDNVREWVEALYDLWLGSGVQEQVRGRDEETWGGGEEKGTE